ncbi:MAG: TldD/PmbA family protein, partial [Desulfobacterales bacterium]|nr:TldD/PmbA family protein [Desulfobacterales bacterium]
SLGADYADIRVHLSDETEILGTLNGTLDACDYLRKKGFGIRALVKGAWGFAGGESFSDMEAAARKAAENAETASRMTEIKVGFTPKTVHKDLYQDPVNTDPFTVPLKEKAAHLLELDERIQRDGLSHRGASAEFYRKDVLFFDTEGAEIRKKLVDVNGTLFAFANDKDGKQQRRAHHLFYDADGSAGWDNLLDQGSFTSYAPRVSEELLQVCSAPECENGVRDLIILNNQMALQTHETIGHALELDRILGYELSYAGGSLVDLADFGALRYGSEKLTVRANGRVTNSPGSFGYDDDGVKAANVVLIDKGILKGAVTSRQMTFEANEKAGRVLFETSGGANRASSYNRTPIERMNNINIDPGRDGSLDDIIRGCEDGLMVETPFSWSIGSNRENFHFSCEIGWKIRDGRVVEVVRNPSYRGDTIPFWNSLDKVGGKETWRLEVVYNCGKGQPNQIMRLGHGIPVCFFKNVQVGG